MSESFHSRLMRWKFNLFPAFRRTGGRVSYLSAELREIHIKLPLNWKTRNYVGTIYGGCMYGVVDGILMVMFINLLGREYIVWDKSGSIRYRRPGRSTLTAKFLISDEELASIRERLNEIEKFDREYHIELVDANGDVCAEIVKELHFRRKGKADDTMKNRNQRAPQ